MPAKLSRKKRKHAATLFLKHRALARRLAKRFAGQFNRPYDEMIGQAEGRLAYELCERWERYDPTRAAESTWIYWCVYWGLKTYCCNLQREPIQFAVLEEEDTVNTSPSPTSAGSRLMHIISELTTEARTLVSIILCAPAEIAEDVTVLTRARGRRAVRGYLTEQLRWDAAQLEKAWTEVETWLRTYEAGDPSCGGSSVVV